MSISDTECFILYQCISARLNSSNAPNMIEVFVDDKAVEVESGSTVLQVNAITQLLNVTDLSIFCFT